MVWYNDWQSCPRVLAATMGGNTGLHRALKWRDLVCNLTGNKSSLRYEINEIQRTRNILSRLKKQYYKLYGKFHQSCTIRTSMLLRGRIGDEISRKGQKHVEGEMTDVRWPMKYMESMWEQHQGIWTSCNTVVETICTWRKVTVLTKCWIRMIQMPTD